MGWFKDVGNAMGKIVEPIPVVSDAVEAVAGMAAEVPVPGAQDFFEGVERGASGEDDRRRNGEGS